MAFVVFLGRRDDSKHLLGWVGAFWAQFDGVAGQKFPPTLASYTAVLLYGPGTWVAYNYVMINSASHPFSNQPAIGSAPPHYGPR